MQVSLVPAMAMSNRESFAYSIFIRGSIMKKLEQRTHTHTDIASYNQVGKAWELLKRIYHPKIGSGCTIAYFCEICSSPQNVAPSRAFCYTWHV